MLAQETLGKERLVQLLKKTGVVGVSPKKAPASPGKHKRRARLRQVIDEHAAIVASLEHASAKWHEN
jgi:hypothetical protein